MNRRERRMSAKQGAAAGPAAAVPPETARAMALALDGAVAAIQQGNAQMAKQHLEHADQLVPNDPDVMQLKGALALQTNDFGAAIRLLGAALKQNPNLPGAHNNMAEAYLALNQAAKAQPHLEVALKLAPDEPLLHYNLGNVQRKLGRPADAANSFQNALAGNPRMFEAANNLGSILVEIGELEAAEDALRKAADLLPHNDTAQTNLANVLRRRRKTDEAIGAYRSALQLNPDNEQAGTELGHALHAAGRTKEGLAQLKQTAARHPAAASPHVALGSIYAERGRFDEAEESLRTALGLDAHATNAWYVLADIHRLNTADAAALEAGLPDGSLDSADRVDLRFALGRTYEDAGDTERAFRNYRMGNDLKSKLQPYDVASIEAEFETLQSVYSKGLFADKAGIGSQEDGPIFIVGMPRSGTTLVEQILASHGDVFGAGELYLLDEVARALPGVAGQPGAGHAAAAALDAAGAATLAQIYLDGTAELSGGARFVTDKMPANFLMLGLIALLMPRARIVHCVRNPLDVALSCYFQHFEIGQTFSNRLDTIADFYGRYRRIMAHWADVLPIPIHTASYEALVAEPDSQIPALVEACGLDWDPHCLDFHRTDRTVATASKWQARQPLFSSSVGKWRRYEAELAPLKQAIDNIDAQYLQK